jgi:HD-like signal output (HDOD) protein
MDTASSAAIGLEQKRDPRELLAIFGAADDLPTLPEVAIHLQKLINDPHSSARDVARIIEQDPAIVTKVLKVVNSAFYAPTSRTPITHLQPAIARLGFLAVANIALSTSVFGAFSRIARPAFDRREFWKHSVCVGIVASLLNEYCADALRENIRRDSVHLAGTVHDLGKILFERYANAEFHEAIATAQREDLPILKEETRLLGMGHDEAGAWLARHWSLAPEIEAVMRWHHDPLACPEPQYHGLIKLVHLADYLCHHQGLGKSGNPHPTCESRIREELQLSPEKLDRIMDDGQREAAASSVLLSLAE